MTGKDLASALLPTVYHWFQSVPAPFLGKTVKNCEDWAGQI